MLIGIIGLGVVGSAIRFGFSKLGHAIKVHDIKLNTNIADVLNTDVVYVCVPTVSLSDGSCDVSIVESVISDLVNLSYNGVIAIKSTVAPGVTDSLIKRHSNDHICMVPEFLRERCAIADFTEHHDICIVGTLNASVFDIIKDCHGHYPKEFKMVSPIEAELSKYFNNVYNATLITFANSFYEVCSSLGADYSVIKNICVRRRHIYDQYIDCNDSFRGFGGPCLEKDTRAIDFICKANSIDVGFFANILHENSKYKSTVFTGMRE